jgi:hypothetical protein
MEIAMNLEELIQLQVLKHKASSVPGRILDKMMESGEYPGEVRQMCAKVSAKLYDELDQVCGLLDMSKRQFIEAAVIDAVDRAHQVITSSGAFDQRGL